tara:strand:+ start:105 stop:563 length:459 start_codon:yes stop_codon:yes gene_type:complete
MPFSPNDFEKEEIKTKLNGVVMGRLFNRPAGSYHQLSKIKQLNYNKELNAYIRANLQGEDWEDVLTKEFNTFVCCYLDDPRQYNIDEYGCKTCDDTKILLKPDQYEFYKSEADKGDAYSQHIIHFAQKGEQFLLDERHLQSQVELQVCNHAC